MGVSLKDLAREAGVSEATASLALNNRPGVSAGTRRRILELADRMGYIPSITAQALAKRKSGLIGVIVPNLSNASYSNLVQMIEDELGERGYKIIIATSKSDPAAEQDIIERFVSFRVEGIILYPSIKSNPHPEYLNILRQYSIPFVFLGGYYPGIQASCVMPDFYDCTFTGARYLYERGGRHFCLISGCRTIASNTLRHQAIADALAQTQAVFDEEDHIELSLADYEQAYAAFSQALQAGKRYDSVIAVNMRIGLAVCNAAADQGLEIPRDLSVIADDSILPVQIYRLPLTRIDHNNQEIVSRAIQKLFNHMAGDPEYTMACVKSHLIPGQSTR